MSDEQPRWLTNALVQIGKLDENTASQKQQNQMARLILRGCEMDGIHPPKIRRDDRGRVRMQWENGHRSAEFVVSRGTSYRVQRFDRERGNVHHVNVAVVCSHYQDRARIVAEWLFPNCTPCSEREIDNLIRVR